MTYCDKSVLAAYCLDKTCDSCYPKEHKHQFWRDRNPAECMTCGKTEIELWHTSGYPQLEMLIEAFFAKETPSESTEKTKDLMRECFLLGKKFS